MVRGFHHSYNVQRIILTNGCGISYIDEGRGDTTLLFIHGLATYALSWRSNIDALKSSFRCIAIDLPGNGFSDRGDYPYSIDFFSGCVYEFIIKMGLTNVCIAGHSMGGQIAMYLLQREPSAADRLILFAPAGFETFTSFEKSMYRSAANMLDLFANDEQSLRESIRNSFYKLQPEAHDMIADLTQLMQAYPPQQYRQMINACVYGMLYEPVYHKLHLIGQATIIFFGEYDALIPNRLIHPLASVRQVAEDGASRLPDARLHLLPKCGHFLQMEKAADVNAIVGTWLSEKTQ